MNNEELLIEKIKFLKKHQDAIINGVVEKLIFDKALKNKAEKKFEELNVEYHQNKNKPNRPNDSYNASPFSQKIDPAFPTYNAQRLSGTNFILPEGPKNEKQTAKFFDNILFHPTLTIKNIVRLGYGNPLNVVYFKPEMNAFTDYVLTPVIKTENCHYYITHNLPSHDLNPKRCIEKDVATDITVVRKSVNEANDIVEETRTAHVDQFAIEDTKSLVPNFIDFEKLERIYQTSLKEFVAVHCSSTVGRTTHLIAIMLFRNPDTIHKLVPDNVEKEGTTVPLIVNNLCEFIEKIREDRFTFLYSDSQFSDAFKIALIWLSKIYRLNLEEELLSTQEDDYDCPPTPPLNQEKIPDNDQTVSYSKKEEISSPEDKENSPPENKKNWLYLSLSDEKPNDTAPTSDVKPTSNKLDENTYPWLSTRKRKNNNEEAKQESKVLNTGSSFTSGHKQ